MVVVGGSSRARAREQAAAAQKEKSARANAAFTVATNLSSLLSALLAEPLQVRRACFMRPACVPVLLD